MTLNEFRREMKAYWQAVNEEADELRDSYIARNRMHDLYRKFDDDERAMADHVLAEWVLSKDEGMRSIAQSLIGEFRIINAIPALAQLAKRLPSSRSPGAPWELEYVNRIIAELSRGASPRR